MFTCSRNLVLDCSNEDCKEVKNLFITMAVNGEQVATGVDCSTQTQVDNNQDANMNQPQEHENVNSVDDGNTLIGNKRKLTSPVWKHFKRMKVNGELKAECNYCKKKLGAKSKNGTRHLHDHYNGCITRKNRDIRQSVLSVGQKTVEGKADISCYNFDADKSRKDLAEMIIVHEYPLAIVDHHGFRKFVSGLQPFFKVPCRNTIKGEIIKIFDYEKKRAMRILEKNASRVAITTDMWTSSNQKKGFMAITAHLIDDNWNMQSRIMRFIYVPCPHTAEVLAEVLYDTLCDWNIDRKLSTITVDNCTTNDALIHLLLDKLPLNTLILGGQIFHMRCCAHILNLIVQDGLSVIDDGIERIRDSVSFWTATPKRIERLYTTDQSEIEAEKVKKLIYELFEDYETTRDQNEMNKCDSDVSTFDHDVSDNGFMADFSKYVEEDNQPTTCSKESEAYCKTIEYDYDDDDDNQSNVTNCNN
ncbi:hypothetical protein L1887_38499 [Cichorium endivia]|nr:hypothetical protein L1887_38499 [Cichorium endivia]